MIQDSQAITKALEDYLETIYLIIRDSKVARVRDIARARDVKMASVTPAMKRLGELGLIDYSQREFIELTPEGERLARRTLARHDILRRFFGEFLQMSADSAEADACAMEHHLSNEGMDRLTRLFEFLARCPGGQNNFLDRFHNCSAIQPELGGEEHVCVHRDEQHCARHQKRKSWTRTLADLRPSETGLITQVNAAGAIRQRLLDMGMLPNTSVTMERLAPTGDPMWVRMDGFQLSLRRNEAQAILIAD
jgi:DtxR family Mn-dependent transcriptional regulator